MYDLWKVRDLDTPTARVSFCGTIIDPLEAHREADAYGLGDYQVVGPAGEVMRQFTLVARRPYAVTGVA